MKNFSCGDVVPGCIRSFVAPDEAELLALVAQHATVDHGMLEIPDDLVQQIRGRIVTV